jgi:hypothetical protein
VRQLTSLAELCTARLADNERSVAEACVLAAARAVGIAELVLQSDTRGAADPEWLRRLRCDATSCALFFAHCYSFNLRRFTFDAGSDVCSVSVFGTQLPYAFEFVGCRQRLVLTSHLERLCTPLL